VTDGTPPAEPRGESGRNWAGRVGQVLGGLLVLALAVSAVAVWWLDRSIDRVDVEGLGELPTGGTEDGGDEFEIAEAEASALTFLVLGSDSREDLTAEQRREFRTGDFDGTRTEVISLVRLAPEAEEVRILNVPRDSRVERCDGTVGKINAAYEIGEASGIGGATCTVETVSRLTNVIIDHVVVVDFEGFVDIVDGLGGVTMQLDEPIQDRGSHLDLPAGCVELDGVDALAFARARQVDDDFGRIARQQRLVNEIRDDLASVGVLEDLPQLLRVADAVASAVELDSSLDLGTIQGLVRAHRSTIRGDLDGRAVPGEVVTLDGVSYVELDEQRLSELASWLRSGTDPAQQVDDPAEGDEVEATGTDEDEVQAAGSNEAAGVDEPGSQPRTLSGQLPAGLGGSSGAESC
jgi:LCP family protein required for cell wall assembly